MKSIIIAMKKHLLFILIVIFVVILSACGKQRINILEKTEMFTLNYGKMDDEIMLSGEDKNASANFHISELCMRDGIFYITNSFLHKVMKFNSYGDILSLYYNEENNPDPFIVKKNEEETNSNRKAIPFPFHEIGVIAVDSDQKLFVAEFTPESHHIMDEEHKTMLTDIVYCFDQKGNYIDFLGQDGFGGMPFPMITKMETNSENHLIVHAKVQESELIFWFNEDMKLLYNIEFPYQYLPIIEHKPIIASLETISATDIGHYLYLKIDYYIREQDQKTEKETDIAFYKSMIYKFDIEEQKYTDFFELPQSFTAQKQTEKVENMPSEKLEVLYQMLGVYGEEDIFLISLINDSQYNLLIIKPDGSITANTKIDSESKELYLSNLSLNSAGIITGLFAGEDGVSVLWWRSDKLLDKKNEK